MTGRFDTIGQDLVAMCVDDLICVGAAPLFFLDYVAVGQLVPEVMEQLVAGIANGCRTAGCRWFTSSGRRCAGGVGVTQPAL